MNSASGTTVKASQLLSMAPETHKMHVVSPHFHRLGSSSMKYYSVAEIEITDRSWVPAYVKKVTRPVEQSGGRYLARTSRIEKIEGERKVPQIYLIIE